jgi:D-alanyl-D-alanine carboxypeptidase
MTIARGPNLSRRCLVLGCGTGILSDVCAGFGNPSDQPRIGHLAKNLHQLLASYAPTRLPGITICIGRRDRKWAGAFGYSNLEESTPIQEFDAIGVGSITKTFVAVVAMQLVEAGQLDLDRVAQDYVGPNHFGDIANIESATIAQLMNHTSGIPSWEDDPQWIRDARGDQASPRIWSPTDSLEYIRGKRALFPAGSKYSYSNTNYTILGLIIEKIAGHPLWHEIARRVCAPLGLTNTFLDGFSKPAQVTHTANRYQYATPHFRATAGLSKFFRRIDANLVDVTQVNLSCEWAAGGILATAQDLVRFFAGLRSGNLLKTSSLKFMTTWKPTDIITQGNPFYVGHGLFRQKVGEYWLIGHTGGVLGSTANVFWIEGTPTVYSVLSNVGIEDIGEHKPSASSVGQDPIVVQMIDQLN